MEKRARFESRWLPYLLIAPQLAITIVFFFLTASQALYQSLLVQDAFGTNTQFVWFENFQALFHDEDYLKSFKVTAVFSVLVASLGLSVSLVLAVFADRVLRGAAVYKTLLIWPYAVAPAVAAILWLFLFNPTLGVVAHWLKGLGVAWDPLLDGTDALIMPSVSTRPPQTRTTVGVRQSARGIAEDTAREDTMRLLEFGVSGRGRRDRGAALRCRRALRSALEAWRGRSCARLRTAPGANGGGRRRALSPLRASTTLRACVRRGPALSRQARARRAGRACAKARYGRGAAFERGPTACTCRRSRSYAVARTA